MEINELYRASNYIKWELLYENMGVIWQLRHKDTGFLFTVRLMNNGNKRRYTINVPADQDTAHDLGKMYFTYVINPLIVADMVRNQRNQVPTAKCSVCERFKNFLKGLIK